jgi:tellurite methyltransferase
MAKKCESYWEDYYKTGAAPEEPSLFAEYVMQRYAKVGKKLIELGCGNGRDAHFFAANGVDVVAVDQCAEEIHQLVSTNGKYPNLHFGAADFTAMPDTKNGGYNMVYSRFTLHSVIAEDQAKTLQWSRRNLAENGLLCVETRGQKNELYQKGEPVEGDPNAYIHDGHYRRFVDFDEFTEEIKETGLSVIEASEQTGYAPYQNTDYHFIRIIAQNK